MVFMSPKLGGQSSLPSSSALRHGFEACEPKVGPRIQSRPTMSKPQSQVPRLSLSAAISAIGTRLPPSSGPCTRSQRLCFPTEPAGRHSTPPSPSTPHIASSSASSWATSPPFIMCHQGWLLSGDQPHLANKKCSFLIVAAPPFPFFGFAATLYSRSQTTQMALEEASTSMGLPQIWPQGAPDSILQPGIAVSAWKKTSPFWLRPKTIFPKVGGGGAGTVQEWPLLLSPPEVLALRGPSKCL
mmetsp:Transcript_161879/g.519207  ORF Transcript_161879/g.519207 Transcript_161879/m.519207 type:complete len:242 (-) Transcript_161879:508-1233(-)